MGHVDRSDQVQPIRTDILQVQIADPVDIGPVQQVPEHFLSDLVGYGLSDEKTAVAVDQNDCDDPQQHADQD